MHHVWVIYFFHGSETENTQNDQARMKETKTDQARMKETKNDQARMIETKRVMVDKWEESKLWIVHCVNALHMNMLIYICRIIKQ